jgi:hypothetical protein
VVILLFGRVSGRASGPSQSHIDDADGLKYVFWKIDRVLRVFSSRRIYRRKSDVRGWTRSPHHLVAWARARPLHPMVRLPSGPLCLLWTLSRVRKIETSAFVSSNSENISCVTFLKHKNSRKQGTGTMASR